MRTTAGAVAKLTLNTGDFTHGVTNAIAALGELNTAASVAKLGIYSLGEALDQIISNGEKRYTAIDVTRSGPKNNGRRTSRTGGDAVETPTPVVVDPEVDAQAVAPAIDEAVKEAASEPVTATVNIAADGGGDGASTGENYADALAGTSKQASSAAGKVASAAASGLGSKVSAARTAGRNTGDGYINGMLVKVAAARTAGIRLGAAGIQGINEGAKNASPSKLGIAAGKFVGDGFAIGMAAKVADAQRGGQQLGAAGIGGLDTAMTGMQSKMAVMTRMRDDFAASMSGHIRMAPTHIDPGVMDAFRQQQQAQGFAAPQTAQAQPAAQTPERPGLAINFYDANLASKNDGERVARKLYRYTDQYNTGFGAKKGV